MISCLLIASKQLSEFEKGQIVTYNDCGQSFHVIPRKLNHYHSSTDVFPPNHKKTGNYDQKGCGHKRKPLYLKTQKL